MTTKRRNGSRSKGVDQETRKDDVRKIGNTLIHGCEAVGEEYFRFLDKAHYAISDAGREAGYNKPMAVYDAAHEIVMPVSRTMLALSAGMARSYLTLLTNVAANSASSGTRR